MYNQKLHSVKNRKPLTYLVLFSIVILLLSYVALQMFILSLDENIREIRKERAELEGEIKELEMEVADLRMGSRIMKIAHEKLGLEVPEGIPEILF